MRHLTIVLLVLLALVGCSSHHPQTNPDEDKKDETDSTEKQDTTRPTITLNGLETINLHINATYEDEGATASDDSDGIITDKIVTTGSVDNTTVGSYTITYNVTDIAGNQATPVTRTVLVSQRPDTTLPTITLNGDSTINLYVGETYQEAGATASDDRDGTITDKIITTGSVDNTTVGNYTITYNVADNAGNQATPVTRTVLVSQRPDTTLPTITLNGDSTINLYVGETYQEAGAIASDDRDGTITDKIITTGSVDNTTVGNYTITYNVTDIAGNQANPVTRTVVVSQRLDTTQPTIRLNGTLTVNLYIGETYQEAGAIASDDRDGTITDKIVTTGSVDTSTIGTYRVTYRVTDNAGNQATPVTRTVVVSQRPDTTSPTITLNGAPTINIYVGETYEDAGATAIDNSDGTLTHRIIMVNPVYTAQTGTYTITYNVSDRAGNSAEQVTRTVVVNEDPATICTPIETLEYGVKGDGISDDTSALNRAFSAEKNLCLSKKYKINGVLNIQGDNISVKGGGVLFRGTRNTNEMLKLKGDNIIIEDLEFDGKDLTPHGISVLEHSSYITFDAINMHNFYARSGDGATLVLSIAGDNCHDIYIQNSSFSNLNGATDGRTGNPQGAVRAIYANTRNSGTTSNNIFIENNTFKNIKTLEDGDAIHFQGTIRNTASPYPSYHDVYIMNNTFINCIKRAIKVQASHIVVENNTIQVQPKMFTPIELFGNYNIVRNNRIDVEHAISGITVKGAYNRVEHNTVIISKTNHYTQYGGGALYGMINLGDNNTFIGNDVTTWAFGYMEKRNTEPGVLNNPMVENTTLEANTFNNSQLTFTNTSGLKFINNTINGQGAHQYYGIHYSSSGHTNFNNREIMTDNTIKKVNRGIIIKNTNSAVRNTVQGSNSFDTVNITVSGS